MLKAAIAAAALLVVSGYAWADHSPEHKAEAGGACSGLNEACRKAGFKVKGMAKPGKEVKADCVDKLIAGEKIAGLEVNDTLVKDCQSKLGGGKMGEGIGSKPKMAVPVPPVPAPEAPKAK